MNHEVGGVEEGEMSFFHSERRVNVTQLWIWWNVAGKNWKVRVKNEMEEN